MGGFKWKETLVGFVVSAGLVCGQQPASPSANKAAPTAIVTVRQAGKKPQKCKVVKSWRQADGKLVYEVQDVASGERLMIVVTAAEAPEAKSTALDRLLHREQEPARATAVTERVQIYPLPGPGPGEVSKAPAKVTTSGTGKDEKELLCKSQGLPEAKERSAAALPKHADGKPAPSPSSPEKPRTEATTKPAKPAIPIAAMPELPKGEVAKPTWEAKPSTPTAAMPALPKAEVVTRPACEAKPSTPAAVVPEQPREDVTARAAWKARPSVPADAMPEPTKAEVVTKTAWKPRDAMPEPANVAALTKPAPEAQSSPPMIVTSEPPKLETVTEPPLDSKPSAPVIVTAEQPTTVTVTVPPVEANPSLTTIVTSDQPKVVTVTIPPVAAPQVVSVPVPPAVEQLVGTHPADPELVKPAGGAAPATVEQPKSVVAVKLPAENQEAPPDTGTQTPAAPPAPATVAAPAVTPKIEEVKKHSSFVTEQAPSADWHQSWGKPEDHVAHAVVHPELPHADMQRPDPLKAPQHYVIPAAEEKPVFKQAAGNTADRVEPVPVQGTMESPVEAPMIVNQPQPYPTPVSEQSPIVIENGSSPVVTEPSIVQREPQNLVEAIRRKLGKNKPAADASQTVEVMPAPTADAAHRGQHWPQSVTAAEMEVAPAKEAGAPANADNSFNDPRNGNSFSTEEEEASRADDRDATAPNAFTPPRNGKDKQQYANAFTPAAPKETPPPQAPKYPPAANAFMNPSVPGPAYAQAEMTGPYQGVQSVVTRLPDPVPPPAQVPSVAQEPSRTAAAPATTAQPSTAQMVAMLHNAPYPSQREWMAESLTDGPADSAVVSALVNAATEDPAATVRATCIRCLAKINPHDDAVIAAVHKLQADPDARVRREAELALAQLGAGSPTSMPSATQPVEPK
jgi:hypothetical protein